MTHTIKALRLKISAGDIVGDVLIGLSAAGTIFAFAAGFAEEQAKSSSWVEQAAQHLVSKGPQGFAP